MGFSISTNFLFTRLNEEKNRGELTTLPKDFYMLVNEYVKSLCGAEASEAITKQAETTKKLVAGLIEKRRQKLLVYIAYNKTLPQPIPDEEEGLYNEIRKVLSTNSTKTRLSKIKITSDIPEILTPQGRKVGPFKQGELVELADDADVDFIIKNKIGEPIN